jgi:hypothetical protein
MLYGEPWLAVTEGQAHRFFVERLRDVVEEVPPSDELPTTRACSRATFPTA